MKYLATSVLICFAVTLFGQFRLISDSTPSWTTVNDSTYTASISFSADQTGFGYLATQIDTTFRLFTGIEQLYRIDSVWSTSFSGASLRVVEISPTNGSPAGQIAVFDPDGREDIPAAPFGSTGSTAQMQAAVVTWNSKQEKRGYVDSLHAAQQAQLDTLPTGTGATNRLALWKTASTLDSSWLSQEGSAELRINQPSVLGLGGITTAQLPAANAGQFYYNSSLNRLNFVDGSGVRRGVAWQEGTGDFANGHIPFAGAGGGLVSNSNLRYDAITNSLELGGPLRLPSWTVTTRPANPLSGWVGYNSSTIRQSLELWNATTSDWDLIPLIEGNIPVDNSILAMVDSRVVPFHSINSTFLDVKIGTNSAKLSVNNTNNVELELVNNRTASFPEFALSSRIRMIRGPNNKPTTNREISQIEALSLHNDTARPRARWTVIDTAAAGVNNPSGVLTHSLHEININGTYKTIFHVNAEGMTILSRQRPSRALDIRGGLRVLPDSLQSTSTKLAGWNAQGDATGIAVQSPLSLENDTLKHMPARGQLHWTAADTIVAGGYRILKNASSSFLQDFTATDSTLTYTGTGGVFKIDASLNIEIRTSDSGSFFIESAVYKNGAQISTTKKTTPTYVEGEPVWFLESNIAALVELEEDDVLDIRVQPTTKANTTFLVEGATLTITQQ